VVIALTLATTGAALRSAAVRADVGSAQRDWEDGYRRLQFDASDRRRADALHAQVDAVTRELRKRVGSTYTTAELAQAYYGSEHWARDAVAEAAEAPGWERTLADATDASFHVYARGAVDYKP
jgi:hypothetical protein